jgi:trimethylamine corrinoid protein
MRLIETYFIFGTSHSYRAQFSEEAELGKEDILEQLRKAIREFDVDQAKHYSQEAIEARMDPVEVIKTGPATALKEIGDKFAHGELFLPELVAASQAGEASIAVLNEEIAKRSQSRKGLGKFLIGTVSGDVHSIGKNIVATMLRVAGFDVTDLGVDVPTDVFIQKVKELKPELLGLSALLTTTMEVQREIVRRLIEKGLRGKVKVMVGGAPVSPEWARELGADAVGFDAQDAVEKALKLLRG